MKQLSKEQIVDETVNFYSEDTKRRATAIGEVSDTKDPLGSTCVYNTEDGRHCAVGRCLLPVYHEQGVNLLGNDKILDDLLMDNDKELDDMLQKQYRGQTKSFWFKLQRLHDGDSNWDKKGLTYFGKHMVNELKFKD